jgi:hypothetical protein
VRCALLVATGFPDFPKHRFESRIFDERMEAAW